MKKEEKFALERKIQKRESEIEYRKTYNTTIIGALTFVAGLLWRDVISSIMDLLPAQQGLIGNFIFTFVVTAIFVRIIVLINKRTKALDRELEKDKEKLDKGK